MRRSLLDHWRLALIPNIIETKRYVSSFCWEIQYLVSSWLLLSIVFFFRRHLRGYCLRLTSFCDNAFVGVKWHVVVATAIDSRRTTIRNTSSSYQFELPIEAGANRELILMAASLFTVPVRSLSPHIHGIFSTATVPCCIFLLKNGNVFLHVWQKLVSLGHFVHWFIFHNEVSFRLQWPLLATGTSLISVDMGYWLVYSWTNLKKNTTSVFDTIFPVQTSLHPKRVGLNFWNNESHEEGTSGRKKDHITTQISRFFVLVSSLSLPLVIALCVKNNIKNAS